MDLSPLLRPYTFPPLDLALETDWDRKLSLLAEASLRRADHNGQRCAELAVPAVPAASGADGPDHDRRGLAQPGIGGPRRRQVRSLPRGVPLDPWVAPTIRLQETYPCSEGFIAFGEPGSGLLRLIVDHGLFYEFVPVEDLSSSKPERHWLGNAAVGVNYAIVVSTCAGHVGPS